MKNSNVFKWESFFPSIKLKGSGVKKFLHGQTTVDILNANTGKPFLACWLSVSGQVRAIFEINLSETDATLISIVGKLNEVKEGFEDVIFPSDDVEILSSQDIFRTQEMEFGIDWTQSNIQWDSTPRDNKDNKNNDKTRFQKIALANWLLLRENQMFKEYNPYELGLSCLINLNKGCYLGQEVMARINRNKNIYKRLCYWESESILNMRSNLITYIDENNSKSKKIIGDILISKEENDNGSYGLAMIKTKNIDRNVMSANEEALSFLKMIDLT